MGFECPYSALTTSPTSVLSLSISVPRAPALDVAKPFAPTRCCRTKNKNLCDNSPAQILIELCQQR
ncbi:hypothetical protein SAMN04489740_3207 [Arthrobacter alpinus]|uniref:Uncharacterized protein n=1 Tax=Arthrobacter alpinus TaxID=656366 RepID=A0A1H5MWW4_9MICC|nr:hypothetical protein SAMN04489740_3207 [Arthrobacter alpinus]